jgi:hypothetical protein
MERSLEQLTDTAGVRRFDYLVQAMRRLRPRRIIFGSDGPWLHPGLELHKVRLLGLNAQEERDVPTARCCAYCSAGVRRSAASAGCPRSAPMRGQRRVGPPTR